MPRAGDADFRQELLAARANELADGLGNLVSRTLALLDRFRPEGVAAAPRPPDEASTVLRAIAELRAHTDGAIERFDFRGGADAIWGAVSEANRFVSATQPWQLARAEREGDPAARAALDGVLTVLVQACRVIAGELRPFLPDAATRIEGALAAGDPKLGRTLFRKV